MKRSFINISYVLYESRLRLKRSFVLFPIKHRKSAVWVCPALMKVDCRSEYSISKKFIKLHNCIKITCLKLLQFFYAVKRDRTTRKSHLIACQLT
jgi:hypothetical protein